MSNVKQRARIARVRRIQHGLAALAATRAQDHVEALEHNEERLKQMRHALSAAAGPCMGADLAGRAELAMRLEAAREGLAKTIVGAKKAMNLREQARIGARRDQESAEQLEVRAASAAARKQDRRSAALFRPRLRNQIKGEAE
jgi:surfactin synthase thioesterase subunit